MTHQKLKELFKIILKFCIGLFSFGCSPSYSRGIDERIEMFSCLLVQLIGVGFFVDRGCKSKHITDI